MGSEAWELERRYSVPGALDTRGLEGPPASEDLHAWSIYRYTPAASNNVSEFGMRARELPVCVCVWGAIPVFNTTL